MDLFRARLRSTGPAVALGRRSTQKKTEAPAALRRRRALAQALTVALLAALLAPLAGYPLGGALAADEEPVATEDAARARPLDGEGEGGPEEPPVVEETPIADPDITQDPYTSAIYVSMRTCAGDHGGDFQQLVANCWTGYSIAFDVSGGGVLQQSAAGDFAATDLPAGQYTIHAAGLPGYAPPLAFCGVAPTGFEIDVSPVAVSDGSYGFTLDYDQTISCYWFYAPIPGGEVAIHVKKRFCPAGFDAYANNDPALLRETCQGIEPVWFGLYNGFGSEYGSGETDGNGEIAFEHLPADLYNVVEPAIEGYGAPVVVCNLTIVTGQQSGDQLWQPWQGDGTWIIGETFNGGDVLACEWFNVPLDEVINVVKVGALTCPAGQELDQLSLEELYNEVCPVVAPDVSFELIGAVTGIIGPTPTDDYGQLTMYGPPVDHYTLTEEVPAGYGTPIVFCAITPPDEDLQTYERYTVSAENGIEFDLGQDELVQCYWFNVPAADEVDVGMLTIVKRFCPADLGFDPYAADVGTLSQGCVGQHGPSVGFELASQTGGQFPTFYTGPGETSSVDWVGIPAGQVEVTELAPDDYGAPVVFCFVLGSTSDDIEPLPVDVAGRTAGFAFPAGQEVACAWFNIPAAESGADPDGEGGTATVVKYVCPEGTLLADEAVEWYQDTCPQTAEGVSFTLTDAGYQSLGEHQTDAAGQAAWTGLRADWHYLAEDLPAGYGTPAVFCDRHGASEGEPPRYERYGVSVQELIQFSLAEGQSIHCYWFNVPIGDDTATAYINLHTCPTGFDAGGGDIFDLAAGCQGYEDGIQFFAYADPDHMLDAQLTGDSFDFGVKFLGLPATDLVFTGRGLYGYGQPIVFCEVTDRDLTEHGRQQATVVPSDGSYAGEYYIAWALNAGDLLYCDWFEVPLIDSPDAGTLTIYKYVCEDNGTDYYSADADTIDSNCDSYYENGVTFDYYNHTIDKTETQTTEHRGQDNSATVIWAPTPAGPVTVTEHPWDGYGTPLVWCASTGDGEEYSELEVEVEDWSADFAIPAGEHVLCSWFNIPDSDAARDSDDPGAVYVYKRVCPADAGFDYYAADRETFDSPDSPCTFYEGDDVAFDLYSDASGETETRSIDPDIAAAAWEQVPAGEVTITEHAWEGYGSPRVFCGVSRDTAFDYFPVEVDGWSTTFEVQSGQTILCFWFNIPQDDEPDEDGGTIAVTTWVCPKGSQAYKLSLGQLYEVCSDATEGVDFSLSGAAELQGVTDADGRLAFEALAAGEYRLTELLSAGYRRPLVFCRLNVGDGALGYETAPERFQVGGRNEYGIGLELESGTSWSCDWFNVPAEPRLAGNGNNLAIARFRSEDDPIVGRTRELLGAGRAAGAVGKSPTIAGRPGVGTRNFLPATWPRIGPADPTADRAA